MTDLHKPVRDALATFLDAAPGTPQIVDQQVANNRRRPFAFVACALVLAAATVGTIIVARDDTSTRTIDPAESIAPSLAPATSIAAVPAVTEVSSPHGTEPAPTTTLSDGSWQVLTDPSSISRSQVFDITGGPAGFVAVGQGFDDGKNQGRLWFSPDGITWEEPALAQFDTMWVSSVTATSTAFYALATPNTDRVASGPSVLYSSPDGITWTPLGNPPGSLDVVGEFLISISDKHPATTNTQGILTRDQKMQVSTDGVTWTPTTFVGADPDNQMSFPATPIVHSNGRHYVMTAESTPGTDPVTRIWSTTDGRTWTALPDPPFMGRLVGTPDGLMLAANTAWSDCRPSPAMPTDVAAVEARAEQLWSCVGDTRLTFLPESALAWTTLTPRGIPRTQTVQPIASNSDALVMPVTTTMRHLMLVASYDGGATWLPQAVDVDLDPDGSSAGGSPPTAMKATGHGTTVFAVTVSSSTSSGPGTVLVVGHA